MNGLLIQRGSKEFESGVEQKVDFFVNFTAIPTVVHSPWTTQADTANRQLSPVWDINLGYFYTYINTAYPKGATWIAIGY